MTEEIKSENLKDFTAEELSSLSKPSNLHLLIHGKVYAIAKFIDEHPGGDEVLFGESGKDATEAFEDVGHSEEARRLMDQYLVGTCKEHATKGPPTAKKSAQSVTNQIHQDQSSGGMGYLLPLALLAGYLSYS
ncbi:cytochrome b5 [Melampsora americana]|nr:cytochrome b5 [Melampsora americana]